MEQEYSSGGPRRIIQIHDGSFSILYQQWYKPQNDYLYKTALSRRLPRFHQLGDVVYAQTVESFFIKVVNSPRSQDFLKQIELDDTVDNEEVSVIISAEHDKRNCQLPRSANKSCNHRSWKRSFSAARRLKT